MQRPIAIGIGYATHHAGLILISYLGFRRSEGRSVTRGSRRLCIAVARSIRVRYVTSHLAKE